MKNFDYSQCLLESVSGRKLTSWIPSKHAIVGKSLVIKESSSKDEFECVVKEVYGSSKWDNVKKRSEDYRNTRKASDV